MSSQATTDVAQPVPGSRPSPRPGQWVTVAVLVVAQMLIWLDSSILNVAIKPLADPARGLGADPGQIQWVISSYTLVFAALLFTGGVLGDRFGHRATLTVGLLIFGSASAWAAFSGSPNELVVARGTMGIGAAMLMPATLAIIMRAVPAQKRARAVALWASSSGLGIAVGPTVGGSLLDHFWWGSAFLVNVPVVILALLGIARWVPEFKDATGRPFDPAGTLLSLAGLLALVFGVIRGGQLGRWTGLQVWGSMVLGAVLLTVFVLVEKNIKAPGFDIRLFRERRFAGGSLGLAFAFFGLSGQIYYSSFYMQGVREMSALSTGLALLPPAIGVMIGTQISPHLVRRFTTRSVVACGMLVASATYGGHLFFGKTTPFSWYEVMLACQGIGMGLVTAPTTTAVISSLPRDRAGAGSAVNTAMRQIGSTLGVAVLGSILSATYTHRITDSLGSLPASSRTAAQVSAESARFVAHRLGLPNLAAEADRSFLHAMYVTSVWATVVSLVGVVLIVLFLRPTSQE